MTDVDVTVAMAVVVVPEPEPEANGLLSARETTQATMTAKLVVVVVVGKGPDRRSPDGREIARVYGLLTSSFPLRGFRLSLDAAAD